MRFVIIASFILIVVLCEQDLQTTLTDDEKNLIKCCFLKLDCCNQQPTTFEVRALLVKCHKSGSDSEKKKQYMTVRKVRCESESKGSLQDCKKKIKFTIKIKNVGLTNCKSQYILIDHIFDSLTGQKQKLFYPYVIKINQKPILEIYQLVYDGMVNSRAKEMVYNKNTPGYKGCDENDSNTLSKSRCGMVDYKNESIPYSSGFCCSCNGKNKDLDDKNFPNGFSGVSQNELLTNNYADPSNLDLTDLTSNIQRRGGQDCSEKYTPPDLNPETYHSSSHCLQFSDLWYLVYCVQKPKIQHTISLQIFQKHQIPDAEWKWKDVTKKMPIIMGTEFQDYINEDSSITAQYVPVEVNEANFVLNYNFHKILIPDTSNIDNIQVYPEAQGGPEEYLVVKSNKIQPNGRTCNVPGVGYEAFIKQPNRCAVARETCLKNQPFHMWNEDHLKRIQGKRGNFFLQNFGILSVDSETCSSTENRSLSLLYAKSYTSTLEIEVKDDDNSILRVNSLAAITEVYVDSTDSQKTTILAKIFNTGLVASVFYISMTDCPLSLPASFSHITSMPALIPPQHHHVFKLDIQCPLTKRKIFCSLHVLNMNKELIAIRKIRMERTDRCICVWYCSCTCYKADSGLRCDVLSLVAYHAAGFQGGMPVPLQVVEYTFADYLISMMVYIIITLAVTLLLMGIIKALLGLCVVSIGLWGLDVVLDLPRKIDRYYEDAISHRRVIYDEFGWPVHPETKVKVRNVPLQAEFCLNVVFFIIYPFCIIWNFSKKNRFDSLEDIDCTSTTVCYCKQGVSVKRKNNGLQSSLRRKLSPEK